MGEKKKILVISGNSMMRQFLIDSLEAHYEILGTGKTQKENINFMVLMESPDLVILDIMMPNVEAGIEVGLWLRAFCQIPIMMLTMRGCDKKELRGLDLEAKDHLTEPFSAAELIRKIAEVIQ